MRCWRATEHQAGQRPQPAHADGLAGLVLLTIAPALGYQLCALDAFDRMLDELRRPHAFDRVRESW